MTLFLFTSCLLPLIYLHTRLNDLVSYNTWYMCFYVKLKVNEAWKLGQTDLICLGCLQTPVDNPQTKLYDPRLQGSWDLNLDVKLDQSQRSMTTRSNGPNLNGMLTDSHSYVPTLSNMIPGYGDQLGRKTVVHWSMKCRSKWPTFSGMLSVS